MLFGSHLYSAPLGTHQAPPLPSISPKVFQLAFVHSSKNLQSIPRSKFSYSEDFVDNERLEWVGDALLYSIVAAYLYRTYPKLRVSYLSSIRQRLVQNSTLAKFATLYNMQEALELGDGYEKLRDDEKTRADAFEAFVGAVAQVHGTEILTKWLEDLIRPYASQLHDFHAATLGQQPEPQVEIASDTATEATKAATRYRLCGFFQIPFLHRPLVKAISPSSLNEEQAFTVSTSTQAYGTFGRTFKAPSGSIQGFSRLTDEESDSPATRAQKGKHNQQGVPSVAIPQTTNFNDKPTSILPARVADSQRGAIKQGDVGSSSSVVRQAPETPRITAKSAFKTENEGKITPSASTKIAQPSHGKSAPNYPDGWKAVQQGLHTEVLPKPAVVTSTDAVSKQNSSTDFVQALQAIRSDPVSFLEKHAQYGKRGSATITYMVTTQGKKSVAQALIGQRLVGQGSAAQGDVNMAKGRAAFKAVEALNLLPDPTQLAVGDSSAVATGAGRKTDEDSATRDAVVRISSDHQNSLSGKPTMPGSVPNQKGTDGPFQKPLDVFPVTQLVTVPQGKPTLSKQVMPVDGLPIAVFNSLPGPDKTSETAQYFILAVKGFSGGVYCGILNNQRQLIGQASSTKKLEAMEAATKIAAKGRVQASCSWKFVDNEKDQKLGKIAQCKGKRETTGIVPTLTHALGVDATEPSRLIWLEWWAEDKKLWKCTVLADGIFVASGKHADRKTAYNQASSNALDELEKRASV